MKKGIKKIIEEGLQLGEKHENLRKEILTDDTISQELKEQLYKLDYQFKTKWSEEDKSIEDNIKNNKKIIGYDKETFLPIFEK